MRTDAQTNLEKQKTAGLALLMTAVAAGFVVQVVVLPRDAQAVRSPRRASAAPLAASAGVAPPAAATASPSATTPFYRRSRPARSSRIGLAAPAVPRETARTQSREGASGRTADPVTAARRVPRTAAPVDRTAPTYEPLALRSAGPAASRVAPPPDGGPVEPVAFAGVRPPQEGGGRAGSWAAGMPPHVPGATPVTDPAPGDDLEDTDLPAGPAADDREPASRQISTPDSDSLGTQMLVLGPATAREGEMVTYAISVEGARNIAHSPLRVSFDPQVLRFVEAQEGSLLSMDGAATQFLAREEGGEGLIDIAVSRMPPAKGITGSGTLCTVTFVARGEGGSPILVTGSRLLDAAGHRVAFRGSDAQVAVQP